MRRWNGWGDESVDYPLTGSVIRYLEQTVGEAGPARGVSFEQVLASVPKSRLPESSPASTDPADRLLHARGQSLPDWAAFGSGEIGTFPDGVAYPETDDQVRELLGWAKSSGTVLIPYGGGTSVVGHINPLPSDRPVVTVDMSRMNSLLELDETSRLAVFGAGVTGPSLEEQLRGRGYTLGHYPQSHELSTLGGWIAARSSGQQSYYYGRIEDLFAGGHVETPAGPLDLPGVPASAAGPDIRQMVLGSEGRLGIITRASVRIREIPERESFFGVFFRDWRSGVSSLRESAHEGIPVSMLRLSDPVETETTLILSGKESLLKWGNKGLNVLGYSSGRCLMIFGVTGSRAETGFAKKRAISVARAHGGLYTGDLIGRAWKKSRFLTPYLRNTLWDRGYATDTLETAIPWSKVEETAEGMRKTIRASFEERGERALIFYHLSHVYKDGASIYLTCVFRRADTSAETLRCWESFKTRVSRYIVECGGTISHQHGVGVDHAPYLETEAGPTGVHMLRALMRDADPDGLLNPGKLII